MSLVVSVLMCSWLLLAKGRVFKAPSNTAKSESLWCLSKG